MTTSNPLPGLPTMAELMASGHDEHALGPQLERITRTVYTAVMDRLADAPDLTVENIAEVSRPAAQAAAQAEDSVLLLYGDWPEVIARAYVTYVSKMAVRDWSAGTRGARL